MTYEILQYGIKIKVINSGASLLDSNLIYEFAGTSDDEEFEKCRIAVDVIESLILAQAAVGIDIESSQYTEALTSCIDGIRNNLCD